MRQNFETQEKIAAKDSLTCRVVSVRHHNLDLNVRKIFFTTVQKLKEKRELHVLDMAKIGRDGTIADDGIDVLIRTRGINGCLITTRIVEIPVCFIQLSCYFSNGFHYMYTLKLVNFIFSLHCFHC